MQKFILEKIKIKTKDLNFSLFQWIIVVIRSLILLSVIGFNVLFQSFITFTSSLFPFQIWKRYISCLINLIMNRIALLGLGYLTFESQNFKFFSKTQTKLTLKSGFIGMGTHKNIIDFFYYSCIFNPVFVKLIVIVEKEKINDWQYETIKQINYAPLIYTQALQCALYNRGFDPIIVRNQKELKKVKHRKMAMKTLVSECFEELKGPIFVLLPGLNLNQHVQIQKILAQDIFDNQLKFLRSGVGLKVKFDERPIFQQKCQDQIHFVLKLMSQLKINHLSVDSFTFRKDFRYQYNKETYRDFIEENFYLQEKDIKFQKINYIKYIENLNEQEEKQKRKHKQLKKAE